ncbi:MAG: tellurite resistance TerB family protein [Hyphomicrobiaceae bacterium]
MREGAGRIDDATGASTHARDALGRATGKSPEELVQQIRDLIANNQLGAGAALGGLGAILLGTGAGRSLAASAVKLGGLALIGGLAYKAYQNYQQGQPVLTGRQALLAAPAGSGFEPAAVTNENATLLIRTMIAAAAADGRIDAKEQQGIIGGMEQAGAGSGAREFLMREAGNPASIEELADAVNSPQEALQVYTAARIAVDPDEQEEHEFLAALADRLGIDAKLAAQVDAAARGAGA